MTLQKGFLRHLDFISVDLCSVFLALMLTQGINVFCFQDTSTSFTPMYVLLPVLSVCISFMTDTYNGILRRGYLKEFFALFKRELGILCAFLMLLFFLHSMPMLPRRVVAIYFFMNFPIAYLLRKIHKNNLRKIYKQVKYARQIMVISTEAAARDILGMVTESAIRNYQFFGLAILDKSMIGEKIDNATVTTDKENMIEYVKNHVVDEVFINLPDHPQEAAELSEQLLDMGVTVHIYLENKFRHLPNRYIGNVFGYNVLTTSISHISYRQTLAKRTLDIIGGFFGCLGTLFLTIIIGPVIFCQSPGPIFFSQTRVGKKGRPFKIYKFRSMYMDAEERKKELMKENKMQDGMMFKMDNDPRIIKGVGHFIRKTSLDEFPQFWNVLKGDMSLVGTRPPTVDEYERYSPHHKRRLSMQPGITGLWQTSGRSNITDFEEVVRLDTEYIENWSLELDIKLLIKTVVNIFKDDEGAV